MPDFTQLMSYVDKFAGANIVVTGGSGFIGAHLCHALARIERVTLTVLDDLSTGSKALLYSLAPKSKLIYHKLGSDDPDQLAEALRGADFLFHLAAVKHQTGKDNRRGVFSSNVKGTFELFECAATLGIKKIVFASSLYTYGKSSGSPFRESEMAEPRTIYGVSKLTGEHLLQSCISHYKIGGVTLRYFFTYGPYQYSGSGYKSVIVNNFERILHNESPVICGDGTQTLDYIYVGDIVNASILAMASDTSGEIINVASGSGVSINQLTDIMLRVSGSSLSANYISADETHGTSRVGDNSKLKQLLNFEPCVPLFDGLTATWQWIQQRNKA